MKPIEAFPLVERAIKEAEARAEISETTPTGNGTHGSAPRNAEVDANHHQGREDRSGPKDPVPGKLVCVPALECGSDVAGKDDVRGIGSDAKNDEALWERGQYKGQGQRIKGSGGQAG